MSVAGYHAPLDAGGRSVSMRIILANPRGFCAGVYMAIDVVDQLLDIVNDEPIYVFHEIVHNQHVVKRFQRPDDGAPFWPYSILLGKVQLVEVLHLVLQHLHPSLHSRSSASD